MPCPDANKTSFRYIMLFLNCWLTFGSFFCYDMPSVLQTRFQCVSNKTLNNSTKLDDSSNPECLGLTPTQYNMLFAIYAWTSAIIVAGAGFFIDKFGNAVGAILFSFLCVLGTSLFAVGSHLVGTPAMIPMMFLGRLLFGAGNNSLTVVQSRLSAFWFREKELAMAIGVTLAFSRLGSVLNFLLTVRFADRFGLIRTLWGGAILCLIGLMASILVGLLDSIGMKQLGILEENNQDAKKLKITDVKNFGLPFWLLALMIMFFYIGVFPFVADASKFIQDKYQYSQVAASYIEGSVYYLSMVLCPLIGYTVDIIGKRGWLSILCALTTTPVFVLLAFTTVPPLILTMWLGVTYSLAVTCMFASTPLVVMQSAVGTAIGLVFSLQMLGVGISNFIIGTILEIDESEEEIGNVLLMKWEYVMIYILINNLLCVIFSVALNIVDKRRDNVLNLSSAQKMQLLFQKEENHKDTLNGFVKNKEDIEKDLLVPSR